jgi:hypothetical protein
MPAFEDQLSPIELKAVSVFVFSHAATEEPSRAGASNRGRRTTGAKGAKSAARGAVTTTGSSRRAAQ